jgi:CRISPR-associated protein (TIGR03984 family)
MKLRKIKSGQYQTKLIDVDGISDNPRSWLAEQACKYALTTLLAHADDGVIWGRIVSDELVTSEQPFPDISPPLRALTLQQARFFGPEAELLLWREEAGWQARLVQESSGDSVDYYDEAQLLWGNQHKEIKDGFTQVSEGQQGLLHAPPIEAPKTVFSPTHHPLRLDVRHYLMTDPETGLLWVALSRLVAVRFVAPAQSKEVQS